MIIELLLICSLSFSIITLVLVYFLPDLVRDAVREELKRLFEGE